MSDKLTKIFCPICKKQVPKRGIFGHLRLAHGKTTEEAHEIMGVQRGALDEKITKIPLTEDELKEANINRIFGLFEKVGTISRRMKELGEGMGFYAFLGDETEGELIDCLNDIMNNALDEIEQLGIGFKTTDTNLKEILDYEKERTIKILSLVNILKQIDDAVEDLKKEKPTVGNFYVTDEYNEDFTGSLDVLEDKIIDDLKNLGVEFKSEEGEEDEEDEEDEESEDGNPKEEKKSWFQKLFGDE